MSDIPILAILYCLAYGVGLIISKFWVWLRIIALILIANTLLNFELQEITLPFIFVFIVPIFLLAYPSIKISIKNFNFRINPFGWIGEKINEKRYLKKREKEQERERETLEQAERIIRMQAEEAERQRQFEREKAEREKEERKTREQTKADTNKDPYEVLGVSRNTSFEEVRKAYRELANKYHPDKVSHLAPEFQEMANEKLKEINVAWEKIKKEKG
jgi:DnaJ-domain-containing protein 1